MVGDRFNPSCSFAKSKQMKVGEKGLSPIPIWQDARADKGDGGDDDPFE
jgi:hypothetical protein